jgi:hypothetical protein
MPDQQQQESIVRRNSIVITANLVLLILLSACGNPARVVIMQNPETKQTVDCKVDPWGHVNRTKQIDDCVEAYRKAGYNVAGDSN